MTKVTQILVSIAALAALSAPVFAQDDAGPEQGPPTKTEQSSGGPDVQGLKDCLSRICVSSHGKQFCFSQAVRDTPNDDPTKFGGQITLPSMQAVNAHPLWRDHAEDIAKCRAHFGL